ncbi:MAG: response regulator [Clostridia bacterium]|nr:response regulator [Clostridia bacterium]
MLTYLVYGMVYLGSALMVYNIISYSRFARRIVRMEKWDQHAKLEIYIPIILLVMFLFGYLAVGLFGKPDVIISGILFGGSIFVFIVFLLLRHITTRIQQSERLEAELMAAEASSNAKSAFLSTMSHEMRSPMNAIIGLDNLALHEPGITPQMRGYLEKIDASARHLLDLINDVLDMNRIETGHLTLKNERFSLRDTLMLVNSIIESQCREKGLDYISNAAMNIGDTYLGDAMKLRQVLINILGNAVKFTDAGGFVAFSVGKNEQGALVFTMKDNGVGMSAEFLPQIFNVFSQEDASSTNAYGGTGLGMPLTKRLVEIMGGEITVESEKGKGSMFTVTLPLEAVEDEPAQPASQQQPGDGPKQEEALPSMEGRRALVVEDMEINAEIVMDLLDMEGMSAEHAENGQIAVDMFSAHEAGYYDVILMDLRMPVMNGLTAARSIRALDRPDAKTVPIIALTANAFEEDVQQSLEAGMNHHLPKPADPDMLYATIRKYLLKK